MEENNSSHVLKTRELLNSLSEHSEHNFDSYVSSMYKSIGHIKNQINDPDWSDLKKKAIFILSVKSLEISLSVISLEFIKEEILKSDEFITKLIDALMVDINFLEENEYPLNDLNLIFWVFSKYSEGKNNLLLEKFTEKDTLRILKVLEKAG